MIWHGQLAITKAVVGITKRWYKKVVAVPMTRIAVPIKRYIFNLTRINRLRVMLTWRLVYRFSHLYYTHLQPFLLVD